MNQYVIYITSYIGRVIIGIYSIRLLFMGLGEGSYGLYILVLSLSSLFALFDLGLSNILLKSTIFIRSLDLNRTNIRYIVSDSYLKLIYSSVALHFFISLLLILFLDAIYPEASLIDDIQYLVFLGCCISLFVTLQSWLSQILIGLKELNFLYIFLLITAGIRCYLIYLSVPDLNLLLWRILLLELFIVLFQLVYLYFKTPREYDSDYHKSLQPKLELELSYHNRINFFKLSTIGWFTNHVMRALMPFILPTSALARFDIIVRPLTTLKPMLSNIFGIFLTQNAFQKFQNEKLKEILNYTSIICLAGIPVQHFFAKDIIELWFGIDLVREEVADLHLICITILLLTLNGFQHRVLLTTERKIEKLFYLDIFNVLVMAGCFFLYFTTRDVSAIISIYFLHQVTLAIVLFWHHMNKNLLVTFSTIILFILGVVYSI